MADIYKLINSSNSGGGGGGNPPYTQSFNIASWGTASGGFYTITIDETTHGRGLNPIVQVHELIGGVYEQVDTNTVEIDTLGNIQITVTENLDTRFEGRIIILGE